jgi:AbrB family looped-hinge helix DNA binding protein
MLSAMKPAIVTTMDLAGRLVIPKAVREAAELQPGVRLVLEVVDGRIQIAPEPRDIRIERQGKLKVAVPVSPAEPLRAATVRKTLEAIRSGRDTST